MQRESIHDLARGRWRSLLPMLGVDSKFLVAKRGPCPLCAGKTRFRFDDQRGDGTWICNCGAGNGVDLVMKIKGVGFVEACKLIEQYVGSSTVSIPKVHSESTEARQRDQMAALWGRASALDGTDLASRYLQARGIRLTEWPKFLRFVPDLPFFEDNRRAVYPAMLAKFAAADGSSAILHRTYLEEPGRKASVPEPRKIMPGKMPMGGAVRLFDPAETMGVAEGIETALSASLIFGVPVWSCLTADGLMKWKPPEISKCIFVFGDNDPKFKGQYAAHALGYRLATTGYHVEMRIPHEIGADWNDELSSAALSLGIQEAANG